MVAMYSHKERRCSIGKRIHKGTLILDSSGCFCLRKPGNYDSGLDILLTSSHPLDFKKGNRWIKGHVEYTQVGGGYYFFSGSNWCELSEGMEARYIEECFPQKYRHRCTITYTSVRNSVLLMRGSVSQIFMRRKLVF